MKIICIGRNYPAHAAELGNVVPDEPVFFCKPDSALLPKNMPFFIPDWTRNIHYEVELVVKIERLGKNIAEQFAHRYYSSIGLGIDFTAREVQEELKKKSLPWEKAKSFDGSAVVSEDFLPVASFTNAFIPFSLFRNNEIVQAGNSSQMIFSIDKIIAHVSTYMTLKIGDLIFTGTPEGVGQVHSGDTLAGRIAETEMFSVKIR